MYYLYVTQKVSDIYDEIPEEKREWWHLLMSNENKQPILEWAAKHKKSFKHSNGLKLVQVQGTLPDFFYPRREVKRKTNAAKLLKFINWQP